MPRRAAAWSAVMLIGVAACTGGSVDRSSPTTAATGGVTRYVGANGAVTVEVDAAAPEITIEPLEGDALGLPPGVAPYGAVRLGPAGYDGGATVTFRTDADWGPDVLRLPIGLVERGDGEWVPLETATVSEVGGTITVAFDVPSLATLLVVRSPWGIAIDPWFLIGSVGERWHTSWDVVDPTFERLDATRPFTTYGVPEGEWPVGGSVRPLLEGAVVQSTARSGGAVSVDPLADTGEALYELHLGSGFDLRRPDANQYVEVLSGAGGFTCLSPGAGVYGFQVEVVLAGSDLSFGADDGVGLVIGGDDDVSLRYAIAAPAVCRQHPHTIAAAIAQSHLELSRTATERLLDSMISDPPYGIITPDAEVVAGSVSSRVDLVAHGGFVYEEETVLGVDLRFNASVFGCGTRLVPDRLPGVEFETVCSPNPAPVEPGEMVMVVAEYGDALPSRDAAETHTYAVGLGSTAESGDQPAADPEWDFSQGVDRWYRLVWDPAGRDWSLSVPDADEHGPSAGRAVIAGNTILWLIPASELGADPRGYRVTSQVGDDIASAPGDVNGDDPTQSLEPIVRLEG